MKPEPFRLNRAAYPVAVIVPTRFRDLDTLGHLNNVAIGSFYEEGRAALNRKVFTPHMRRETGSRVLIADVHIAYLAEAHYPGDAEVRCGVQRIGRSSYVLALAIFQNDVCAGTCETVMVHTGPDGASPIPDAARAALEGLMIRAS